MNSNTGATQLLEGLALNMELVLVAVTRQSRVNVLHSHKRGGKHGKALRGLFVSSYRFIQWDGLLRLFS